MSTKELSREQYEVVLGAFDELVYAAYDTEDVAMGWSKRQGEVLADSLVDYYCSNFAGPSLREELGKALGLEPGTCASRQLGYICAFIWQVGKDFAGVDGISPLLRAGRVVGDADEYVAELFSLSGAMGVYGWAQPIGTLLEVDDEGDEVVPEIDVDAVARVAARLVEEAADVYVHGNVALSAVVDRVPERVDGLFVDKADKLLRVVGEAFDTDFPRPTFANLPLLADVWQDLSERIPEGLSDLAEGVGDAVRSAYKAWAGVQEEFGGRIRRHV